MDVNGDEIIEKRRIIESWMSFELHSSPVDFVYFVIVRGRHFSLSTMGHTTSNEAIIEAYNMAREEVRAVVGWIEQEKSS